jgi:hypothetical protein
MNVNIAKDNKKMLKIKVIGEFYNKYYGRTFSMNVTNAIKRECS